MRPREDDLIDPEFAEQLDAIDATLAGEPVSPRFAELAELALLLSAARPEAPRPEFAAELDRRVQGRFRRDAGGSSVRRAVAPRRAASAGGRRGGSGHGRWGRWALTPVLGTAAAGVLIAVVLVTSGGGSGRSSATTASHRAEYAAAPAPLVAAATKSRASAPVAAAPAKSSGAGGGSGAGGAGSVGHVVSSGSGALVYAPAPVKNATVSQASAASHPGAINGSLQTVHSSSGVTTDSPAPLPNGRKIVQSSVLELGTAANRIDTVAQEVFYVVRDYDAIVQSSNVSSTGGPGASAQFQLRVPSTSLPEALSALSRLRYANVISRTDNTEDVNSPYLSAQRGITNGKATLAKLRAKLAAATTETEITSLRMQIANENAAIARTQSSLTSLNRRVDYSNVDVTVQASAGGSSSGGGGFGVGKAGHDALRVLEVTAGVALIGLAAIVPLGLLLALVWWLTITAQRRRRERALDLA
jgi:hypothetical protein